MKSASRIGAGCWSKARWAALVVLTCATLSLGTAAAAFTGGHGGGSHGGASRGGYGHGDHGHHGGFHGRAFIGPVWFGWWDPYPYYYHPYAYAYPGEYTQPDPPTPLAPDAYWYYCAPAGAYYPDVRYCPAPWIKVPPQSPTG